MANTKKQFRNTSGTRDPNRAIKNGFSKKATDMVAQLNGSTLFSNKVINSADQGNTDLRVPVSTAPTTLETPKTPEQLASEAETKRLLEAAGGGNPTHTDAEKAAAEAKAKANPSTATPTVALANAKELPDFIKKKIAAAKGKDDEDEDDGKVPANFKKVKNSIYPSVRGNYQSALSAIRTKLANSEFDDEDDEDEANDESGMDNIPASEIIYGGQDLGTPASELVVTTQAPEVQ